jgi:peptidyl-dipeptidase Dcp
MNNPLLGSFHTPYGVPPFDQIKEKQFKGAIREGIRMQQEEIREILNDVAPSDFENTVMALEHSGQILKQATAILYNLSYAHTSVYLQNLMQELAPKLSLHHDRIFMNPNLFRRVKHLWEHRHALKIRGERGRLLDQYYKAFVRSGAGLGRKQKKELESIHQRLSVLSLQFSRNILECINAYSLAVSDASRLSGIPGDVCAAAAEEATRRSMPGKWVFTLHHPSVIPVLQYADDRSLRQEIWGAFTERGNGHETADNKAIIAETVALRQKRALLLGYKSHAHYVLEERMAKDPDQVMDFLKRLWPPALHMATQEAVALEKLIAEEKQTFKLAPWDWRYYAEKLRRQKFHLDDEAMKPYFSLEKVLQGAFDVASRLYGLSFYEVMNLPVYHQEVSAYEVAQHTDQKLGVLYLDFHPRASKQSGAWMTRFVDQRKVGKKRILPVISIVCNFPAPVAESPSLLSLEEVHTFFHEFGHALHGLLSDVSYASLSGTNVSTDFVELPSQIMENWCIEPEVLTSFAQHYETGEPIPNAMLDAIQQSKRFGQGFATTEYLAASFLDMAWHSGAANDIDSGNVEAFEKKVLDDIGLISEILPRYRSTAFSHIFANGYSAGYYSYIWSEMLDADAFELFKERGIFDPETAEAFRMNILSKGGSEEEDALYRKFRGRNPDISPLLRKRGLM